MAGQINVRISDELEAFLDVWAVEEGRSRADLIRDIVTEAADARREGRLRFAKPDLPSPAELSRLTVTLHLQTGETDRLLTSLARHEKRLTDTQARLAGTEEQVQKRLLDEAIDKIRTAFEPFRSRFERIDKTLAGHPATVAAQLADHPAIAGVVARLDRLCAGQAAHAAAQSENTAALQRVAEQPRTINNYVFWDKHWSGSKAALIALGLWLGCAGSYAVLARVLPDRWLAIRSANMLLGGGEDAICNLVNYRLSTTRCTKQLDATAGTVTVIAGFAKAGHKR